MATTPRGYPYPALSDPPNSPTQTQSLATSIDSDVSAQAASIHMVATVSITLLSGQNSGTNTAVPYGVTFPATPLVFVTVIEAGNYGATTYNETTSQCAVRIFRTDGTNAGANTTVRVKLLIINPAKWG